MGLTDRRHCGDDMLVIVRTDPIPSPTRVLVVDDEQPICDLLVRWLAAWDYSAAAALSADIAVEMMSAVPANVLVCDVKMPGHDGLWLTEYVRSHWPDTAIVMATGLDDLEIVNASRRLGAVDYVLKPFSSVMMRQAVDLAAGRVQYRPSARRNP